MYKGHISTDFWELLFCQYTWENPAIVSNCISGWGGSFYVFIELLHIINVFIIETIQQQNKNSIKRPLGFVKKGLYSVNMSSNDL